MLHTSIVSGVSTGSVVLNNQQFSHFIHCPSHVVTCETDKKDKRDKPVLTSLPVPKFVHYKIY